MNAYDEWFMARQPEEPYREKHLRDAFDSALQQAANLCRAIGDKSSAGDEAEGCYTCEIEIRKLLG